MHLEHYDYVLCGDLLDLILNVGSIIALVLDPVNSSKTFGTTNTTNQRDFVCTNLLHPKGDGLLFTLVDCCAQTLSVIASSQLIVCCVHTARVCGEDLAGVFRLV